MVPEAGSTFRLVRVKTFLREQKKQRYRYEKGINTNKSSMRSEHGFNSLSRNSWTWTTR